MRFKREGLLQNGIDVDLPRFGYHLIVCVDGNQDLDGVVASIHNLSQKGATVHPRQLEIADDDTERLTLKFHQTRFRRIESSPGGRSG